MYYVVVCEDARVYVVGPFETIDDAGDHFKSDVNNPEDDPRWQVIGPCNTQPVCEHMSPINHTSYVASKN